MYDGADDDDGEEGGSIPGGEIIAVFLQSVGVVLSDIQDVVFK